MLVDINKINFLITKKQRKKLLILSILIFIGMTLEVLSLGLFIPVLSSILEPESLENLSSFSFFNEFYFESSYNYFVFLLLFVLCTTFFLKNLFLVYLNYRQNLFISNITAHLSNSLFSKYMSQSFKFHIEKNSSELIKNIQIEINYLVAYLNSLLVVFTESFFTLSIVVTLLYIDPISATSAIVFYGLTSIIMLRVTKSKLSQWGEIRQELDDQSSKIALEGIGGFKELLILDKLSFFIDNFKAKNYLKVRLNANQATLSQIPRYYLEFIALFGLSFFIAVNLFVGKDPKSLIITVGLFVAATFKITPSISKIITSIQSMNFFNPSVKVVYREMSSIIQKQIEKDIQQKFSFHDKIEFKNVNFYYDNKEVLKDFNLTIKRGQIIGFKGESGSGKTTFIDMLLGLYSPSLGNITIDGKIDFQLNQSWRNKIGYVPQSIYLIDDTIKNNIALGICENEINESRIKSLTKQVQLEEFVNNLKEGINTRVGERGTMLSGGQKQRIGIARALYNNPDILILDEATSALDLDTEREVMLTINSLINEKTIIIIAHRLDTLKSCDYVYTIDKGKLV